MRELVLTTAYMDIAVVVIMSDQANQAGRWSTPAESIMARKAA